MKQFYSAVMKRLNLPKRVVKAGRFVLQSCLLMLTLLGLTSQVAKAQLYIVNSNNSNNFQYYNLTTATSTTLTSLTGTQVLGGYTPTIAGVGNYVYVTPNPSGGGAVLRRYDTGTNSWTALSTSSNVTSGATRNLFTDGTSLYHKAQAANNAGPISKYDATAGTWTTLPGALTAVRNTFSGVGVIYYTTTNNTSPLPIISYNPGTGVSTTIGSLTFTGSISLPNTNLCADANNVYGLTSLKKFTKLSITAGTSTSLADAPVDMSEGIVADGTNIYGKDGANIYKYTTATNSWSLASSSALNSGYMAMALAGSYYATVVACTAPTVSASITQATCTGSTANSNGTITLTALSPNATKVDYTIGSTYTGAGFASATTLSGSAPYTVTSTLPNPATNQPYTIRVFCDATNYTDKTVLLTPTKCQTADLSVAVSPATQTGNSGEFLTYTVTLTNAGPNTATNVGVSVPMPDPTATLLSATAATGSYSTTTKKWSVPSLAVGSTTLTFTVKVN